MRRISKKWLQGLVQTHGLAKALNARYKRTGLFEQHPGLDAFDIYIKKLYPKGEDLLPGFPYAWVREELFLELDDACIVRLLGNDLVPRHKLGQTLENTRYLLENEHAFKGCTKFWVLNRIADPAIVAELKQLISSWQQDYLEIPFIPSEYRQIGLEHYTPRQLRQQIGKQENCDRPSAVLTLAIALLQSKIRYAMGINEARNIALRAAALRGRWVLPLDGNCLLKRGEWQTFRKRVRLQRKDIYTLPMARAMDNDDINKPDHLTYSEEPQLAFNRYTNVRFDERYYYSRRDKVELLWRLGKPGVWDKYKDSFFDPERRVHGELKKHYGGDSGRVIRLSSGTEHANISSSERHAMRLRAIVDYIGYLDEQLGVRAEHRLDLDDFTGFLRSLF